MAETASPFTLVATGVTVAVRLTPKASRDRVLGPVADAAGQVALKVQVTAPPEDGKANAALLRALAREWRLPRTAMEIVQGATDRRKVVRIAGDGDTLRQRLEQWMNQHDD